MNMTTFFVVALKPFLLMSKMLGLINFTYTFDSGLLCKNSKNAMHYVCLELIRTTVLIGLTYIFHVNNTFYLRELVLFKFWTIVFMTRIYEIWIIRYHYTYCRTYYNRCNIIVFLFCITYILFY